MSNIAPEREPVDDTVEVGRPTVRWPDEPALDDWRSRMEYELEFHEETWEYAVSYQGLALSLTIHHDLDEPQAPYEWGLSEHRRGMDTPIWWTDKEFSSHEDALVDATGWILENVRDGRMPTQDEAPVDASVDLG